MVKLGIASKAKDWLLAAWLNVCVSVQKGRPITLVDLYAGDGEVQASLPDGTTETWAGSSVRMAEAAARATHGGVHLFVNEAGKRNYKRLLERLEPYKKVVAGSFNLDARVAVDEILPRLNPKHHNFVFIDPYSTAEIDLPTIRRVASVSMLDSYREKIFTRRPEIMFTFMTSGMPRVDESYHDKFFKGFDWRAPFHLDRDAGYPASYSFITALSTAMVDFYANLWQFEVKSPKGPVIYYILFWATHPLANELFPKIQRYAYRHRDQDVLRKYVTLERRVAAIGKRGKTLEAFDANGRTTKSR